MTEDDIRLAMELFGGTGYNDPLSQYNRSREIPKPAPKRKSALDAARFPTLGRGTQPQIGLEPEFRDIDLKQREATIAGLSPLENIQAFGEGARTVGQAAVAGIAQPFAELMGVPADKFYKAAIDLPETAGGIARGEQMIEGVQDFFGAMSESPLAPIVEKIPFSPYSPASAQAIDTGLAQAGKGLKMAGQQAKQAGRQTLEAGKDLAQAARAEFATPPTGAVQLQTQQATRNPLGMYSQAEQVALNLAQEKGTGNQFLAQISKAPGVKPAELEWTGLADFLKSKGDQPVTKQEIASHLMRNKVQVREKQFLAPENYQRMLEDEAGIDLSVTLDAEGVPSYSVYDYPSDSYKTLKFEQLPDEVQDRLSFVQQRYGPAQFYEGDLQLPGGSNYREIALTLPGEELYRVPSAHSFDKQADVNRLVHMRVNDRLDANGDKVLFVEEMQSDWGQKGKKKGFTPRGKTQYGPEFIATSKDGRQFDFYDAGRAQEWLDSQGGGELKKVPLKDTLPSAPFVQNTEDWVNLSLKRLITDAVNNGYKKVAFINGDQSANRYDLSKQIDEVYYFPKTNMLVATKGGENKFNQTVPADKLADYIGKEAAEKLLAAPSSQNLSGSPMQRLSGVDLKVGGEGMKKFYDQIVPATANKLLKKLGGGKLEPIEIGAPIETELSITDMLKDLNIPEQKWLDMPWEEKSKLMDDFAAQNKQRKITQLGFTITPEMVELVKKQGLPMFAAGGAVTMAKGGNPLKAAREGMQAAKKAMKAQRREERVQKNLEAYMGSKEKPKTYYHATQAPEDFEAFDLEKRPTERSAAAVFVTPSTKWANDWAVDELADMDLLEKVDTPKPRIMPVITRAKNTFDYDDLGHVTQVMNQADLPPGLDRQHIADQISIGNWNFIEDRNIQKAIKDLGFDSFFVKEKGVKNMGIFNPGDVKALFNRGSYDPTTADISKANGGAVNVEDMLKNLRESVSAAITQKFAGGGSAMLKGALRGLEAVQSGADKAKPAVSRIDMSYKDVTKRVPELTEAAKKVEAGEMTAEEYAGLVGNVKPVEPYAFVPQPASAEDAMRALTENKRPMFGKTGELKPGERADLRLDIPAYKDHGVWINSIHRASGPTVYGSVSSVKNATMIGAPEKALKVATGQTPKSPFAVIRGEWNPVSEEEAVAKAQLYMQSPEWVQVGYDPERAGYFYDRKTRKPVTAAKEVLQIGPLVLAKKPKFSDVKDQKFAEGGATSNTLLERLRKYKIGGAVEGAQKGMKAASKAMKAANPAKAAAPAKTESVIEDWKWRPTEQVTAEVGLKEVPDYIQGGYGEFMKNQQKRAQAGQMGVRDLIKAYTITRSSVNRSGLPRDTATKTGMKIPQTEGLVRPEGAFAEWLGSKQGQNYLKAADRGEIDEKAIADLQTKFAPFGMASVLADDMRWAVKNAPTLASNLSQTIIGDPQTYRSVSQQLQGIGPAKSGFLGSLVGRGDFPTLDARQLRLHTGAGGAEASKFMRRRGGLGGEQAVGRLAGRQEEMGLDIDPSLNPFYQHLTHHAVWDKVADEQTTHDDLVRAMMGYKDGGEVNLSTGGGDLLKRARAGMAQAKKGMAQEKEKATRKHPIVFEPAEPLKKEEIRAMAQKMAEQSSGQFVRVDPTKSVNPAGKSKKQFEREQALTKNIRTNIPERDIPVVDIAEQEGKLLVAVPGDPTIGGVVRPGSLMQAPRGTRELSGIEDVEFEVPVQLYGGPRYGAESQFSEGVDPAFWASNLSAARGIQNPVSEFSQAMEGAPVLGMYTKMTPESSTYALHTLDALLAYQQPEKLSKTKREQLTRLIKKGTPKEGKFPGFVGFDDPASVLLQARQNPALRKHISATLMKPTITQELKMPSGLDVLTAISHPEIENLPPGSSGFSVGTLRPGSDLFESAHPTYSHDIPGEFMGQTRHPIPLELAFPRTTSYVRKNIPRGDVFNTMKMVGARESIDPQYIDQIKLYEQYMKELTGRKKGGLAKIKKAKVKNGN
jgi:hypothetical protein